MTGKKRPPVKGRRTTVKKSGSSLKERVKKSTPRQATTKTTKKRTETIAPKKRAAYVPPPAKAPIKIQLGGGRTLSRGMLRSLEDRVNGGWGVAELVDGKFQFVDGERFERQDDANTHQEVVEAMRS